MRKKLKVKCKWCPFSSRWAYKLMAHVAYQHGFSRTMERVTALDRRVHDLKRVRSDYASSARSRGKGKLAHKFRESINPRHAQEFKESHDPT